MQASAEAALGCSGQGQQLPAFFLRQADIPGGVIVCCQLELLFKAVHGVLHRCAPDKLPQLPSWGKGQAHRHWCTVPADAPQTGVDRVIGRRIDHSGVVWVRIADIPVQFDATQLHLIAPVLCPDVFPAGHAVILGQRKPRFSKAGDPAIGCKLHLLKHGIQHHRNDAAIRILPCGLLPAAVQPPQKKHHCDHKEHSIGHSVLLSSVRLSRRC